jgi:hypothetical protein
VEINTPKCYELKRLKSSFIGMLTPDTSGFFLTSNKIIMKTSFFFIAAFCFILSENTSAQNSKANNALPYQATYSSNFKIGNQKYAAMVLDLWKDWDDNNFDRHQYMADTVTMYLPDGSVTKGLAANLAGAKKYRGSLKSAKSIVYAWVPLVSVDKNEDAICVWGEEEDVMADGTVDKKTLHEVWFFNKDGKVASMRQWSAKLPPNQ